MRDAHNCSFSFHSKTIMAKKNEKNKDIKEQELKDEIVEEIEITKEEEYLNNWKRCMADFDNYKKRQAEQNVENLKFANRGMIMEIIPVLDNFHASTDHIPEDQKDNAWVTGIMYIQKQLEKVLSDNGVEEVAVKVGDKFDPEIHEALENKEADGKKLKNKIEKIVLKGYKMGGRVIRATKVIVG